MSADSLCFPPLPEKVQTAAKQLQTHLCRGLSWYCPRQTQRPDHKWSKKESYHLCFFCKTHKTTQYLTLNSASLPSLCSACTKRKGWMTSTTTLSRQRGPRSRRPRSTLPTSARYHCFLSLHAVWVCLLLFFAVSKECVCGFQIKYKESWHTLRAQGYKLTMQDIPFQAAKSSTGIASDVNIRSALTSHFISLYTCGG